MDFGGSLVRIMVLIYSPDGTKVYDSRGEKFEDRVGVPLSLTVMVEICKIVFHIGTSYSLVHVAV